jgi:hypothetical protein
MVCGLPLFCLCFYFFQCFDRPCAAGTFSSVSACVSGGLGRGGGTVCSCSPCPSGEMIDMIFPSFSSMTSDFVYCDDQKYVVPSIDRNCVCVLIHVGVAQTTSTVQAHICIYIYILSVTPPLLLRCIQYAFILWLYRHLALVFTGVAPLKLVANA